MEKIKLTSLNLPLNAKPFNLLWVEPGKFKMGSVENKKLNPKEKYSYHKLNIDEFKVEITKGFWLAEFPITQAHWTATTNAELKSKAFYIDPQKLSDELKNFTKEDIPKWRKGNDLPMFWGNWLEAMSFCNLLNERYKELIPKGYHFSLPTEAQWEYACKAGLNEDYVQMTPNEFYDSGIDYYYGIKEVGHQIPNPWGFHDILGNIREMCFDIKNEWFRHKDRKELYPYIDNGVFQDWIAGYLVNERELDPYHEEQYMHRIVKGAYSSVFRESAHIEQILHPSGHYPPLGFRVALRPKTEADINDPVLKWKGIDMIS